MENSTTTPVAVTPEQLAALRSVCERLAHIGGGSLPPDLDSLPALINTLSTLVETCAKRVNRRQHAHEELREARHELENVERLKARFIRSISHEMRTPVASIAGFARALLQMEQKAGKPGAEPPSARRQQFLSIISQEAQRLGKLIEDVLDLSDIESGRRRQEASEFTAKALFEEALLSLRSVRPFPPVALRLKPEGEGPPLYADRAAMVEALRQLLANADRFSGGQEIVLGAELVSIRPDRTAPAADSGLHDRVSSATQIYIRDSGVGIPKEELPHIFDKFYRGEGASPSLPGAGLGLAIVRTLVHQNNGRVWADSEPGRGSTFYLLLPSRPPGGA